MKRTVVYNSGQNRDDSKKKTVKKSGLALTGDKVVITAGLPLKVQGTTNLIRVTTVR